VRRLAVLGAGMMGEALVRGLLTAGWEPDRIVMADVRQGRLDELREVLGVHVEQDNATAAAGAEAVLLAVKPQDATEVLSGLGPDRAVLSIVAGLRTSAIADAVGARTPVVRAMPNTPARVGRGVTALAAGAACDDATRTLAADVFSAVGPVVWLEEDLLDAVTAVSGSGPAYVFYLAEAMLTGAEQVGLDPTTARTLVVQTLRGAAEMLAQDDADPRELRAQVTSPGGTTEAAVAALDAHDVKAALAEAIARAARRSAELGR